jgi:ribosomal protein S18 acetylase RimI-like enzyme
MLYIYRNADEKDKKDIFRLYSLVMSNYISEIWGWDEQWQETDFSNNYNSENITVVIEDKKLVGYSHIEETEIQFFIRMIVVHPEHQGKNIGTTLIKNLLKLSEEKSKRVCLEVFKVNERAKHFYQKYDFFITGENATSYIMSHQS